MKKLLAIFLLLASTAIADPTNISYQGLIDWVKTGGQIGSGSGTLPAASSAGSLYFDISTPTTPLLYRSDGSDWRAAAGSGGSGTSNHSELNQLSYTESGHTGFAAESGSSTILFSVATPTEDYHASTKKYVDEKTISASGTLYHSKLNELSYAESGHTGFAADADIPGNASFTLSGLSEKDFSSLTNTPTTISGYGLTDAASTTALFNHTATQTAHGCTEIASTTAVNTVSTNLNNHIASYSDPHGATMTVSVSLTIGSGTADTSIERVGTGTIAIGSYTQIIPNVATPTYLATGSLWYDSNENKLKCYDGSAWKSLWE